MRTRRFHDVCRGAFAIATYTPGATKPIVINNGPTAEITLRKAVAVDKAATEICQGRSYPTEFEVRFEATRDAVSGPTAVFSPDSPASGRQG